MPRIDQRFLLVLVLACATLCGILYGVHGFQVSRQTDFFLAQADKAWQEGRVAVAANLYSRVITYDRNNPQAVGRLAECLDQMGKHVDAYIAYESASRLADDPDQYLARQVELAILLDRPADAKGFLAKGLQKSPGDPHLLLLMAQSLFREGNYDLAVEKFREVIGKDNPPREAFALLAMVLDERQNRTAEAEAVIEKLLATHADDYAAYVLAAQWYLKQLGDRPIDDQNLRNPRVRSLHQKIEDCAKAALRLNALDKSTLQVGLQDARLRRDEQAVMSLAESGAAHYPEEPAFYEVAAESTFRQGKPDAAAKWLERGLQKIPTSSTLLWDFVGLKLERKEIGEAEQLIERYGNTSPRDVRQALQGRILVAREEWKSAIDLFSAIRSDLTLRPQIARVVDYELAICFGQLRQYDRQINALRRALDAQPFWVEAREALAKALYASGRNDEAVEEFRSVVANRKFSAASGLLMARLMIAQMARRNQDRVDWEQVEAFVQQLEAGGVPHEEVVRLRCGLLVAMEKLSEAEQYVRQEIDQADNLPARLGLAQIQAERRDWNEALRTIREAVTEFGDSVELRRAEAVCLLASQDLTSPGLKDLATPPADWSMSRKTDLAVQMLPVLVSANELDLAEQTVEFLIKNQPNTVSFQIERLNIANLRRNTEQAKAVLADIERIAGRTAFWHYGQAVRIWTARQEGQPILEDDMRTAINHLAEAALERPSWAQVPLLHAVLLDSANNKEAAIAKYRQAIDLGVREPQVIRRVVDLLMKARRFEEADLTLRRLNEEATEQTDNAPTLRIASEMSFQLASFERAVRLAELAAEKSGTAEDYLWLARLLELQERKQEAGHAIAKAVELSPLTETVRVEQVRYLIRDGRKDDAAESVAEFAAALRGRDETSRSALLALGECYMAIGRREQAEEVLMPIMKNLPESLEQSQRTVRLILSLEQTDSALPTVEEYLKKILAGAVDREIQIWARRETALIAAQNIRTHQFADALALIEANLAIEPDSVEDLRAKGLVLAAWPNARQRDEAIAILDSLHRAGDLPNAEDRFLLAELYVVRGSWVLGSRLMRQVLAVPDQQTAQRMGFYANALISHGEVQDGLLWTERLLTLSPSAEAVQLHAQALFKSGEIDQLLMLLPPSESEVRFAANYREFLTPRDSAEIMGRFAEEMITHNRRDSAGRLIERCEEISRSLKQRDAFPGSGIARVLVGTGRLDEALDLLVQTGAAGTDLDVVQYVEAILAKTELTDADALRLRGIVSAEFQRRNQAPALLLAKAQIEEKVRDFDSAIASYRRLISEQGESVAALNNVAFLLALRGDDPAEAVEYATRAMARAGSAPAIIDTYAVALIRNGQESKAIELLESIANAEGLPVSHFHQAWAYSRTGDTESAQKAMRRAGDLGLRNKDLHPLELPIYEQLRVQNIRLAE